MSVEERAVQVPEHPIDEALKQTPHGDVAVGTEGFVEWASSFATVHGITLSELRDVIIRVHEQINREAGRILVDAYGQQNQVQEASNTSEIYSREQHDAMSTLELALLRVHTTRDLTQLNMPIESQENAAGGLTRCEIAKHNFSDAALFPAILEHYSKLSQVSSSSDADHSFAMPVEDVLDLVLVVVTELQRKGIALARKADIKIQEAENKMLRADNKMQEAVNMIQLANDIMHDTTRKGAKLLEDTQNQIYGVVQRATRAEGQMITAQAQAKVAEEKMRTMTMQRNRECEEGAKEKTALVDKSKELQTVIETFKNTVKEKNDVIQEKDGQNEALKSKVEELQSLIDTYETGRAINEDTTLIELHKEREARKAAERETRKLEEQLEQHKTALARARKNEIDRRDMDVYHAGILKYEQQYHRASLRLGKMNAHIKTLEARIAEVQAEHEQKRKVEQELELQTANDQPAEANSAPVLDGTPKSALEVERSPERPNRVVVPSYNNEFPQFPPPGTDRGRPKNQKGAGVLKIV